MHETIESIRRQFSSELHSVTNTEELETVKVKFLGKKGPIQQLMKALKDVSPDQRPEIGKYINALKVDLTASIDARESELVESEESARLENEKIDVTLPGRRRFSGLKHVLLREMDEMIEVLRGMGFAVKYGPDIDTDYYNYEALNFPPHHPARDMQDTFYISQNVMLRTHTSNVQVRVMETEKPPIRVIAPGKVYRNEAISARSHVFFHQIEGFYIDQGVSMADLFSTFQEFLDRYFRSPVKTRFRPSYFPFVEPGVEIDFHCLSCAGNGCSLCKHTGWLEIAGAGMIHPEVLKNGDIDPEVYTGYAFGLGVGRLVMLKYGISDIRLFTENDLRFLRQFPAA